MNLETFKSLQKKDFESFKKIDEYYRKEAFPYLDNKSLEAFKKLENMIDMKFSNI